MTGLHSQSLQDFAITEMNVKSCKRSKTAADFLQIWDKMSHTFI